LWCWCIACLVFFACEDKAPKEKTLLESLPSQSTQIDFVNALSEDKDFNIIEYLYFYNGGGVSIGDINNDSLPDIYFTGNQVGNKLYLNQGNFIFKDITESAGVAGVGNWKTGVNMVDVNADGYLDIFVCGVGNYKKFNGRNQLYINNRDLTFTERTDEFGLTFQGFSTHTAFFDYDLDGDLDMYLLNHSVHTQRSYGPVSLRNQTDSLSGDRLYRNLLVENGTTRFEDVTKQAGIYSSQIGYGLGIGVSDLNDDGYPDLYVSNDFIENDYLYINNGDGTFSQQLENAMAHTSRFSMGNDIADVNNDGFQDVITMDMLPRDEDVIKTSAGEDSYEVYSFKLRYGYHKQVSRNALQINRGPLDGGKLLFQDIAPAAGVEATDWSWGPLMVDFDGDGWKDIFISNGIVRRPNDLDYINFISNDSVQELEDVLPWIKKMPEGKVSNFIFHNNGNLTFEDKTREWGIFSPGYSNGCAIGDLDNDGDPDLVVNQINELPLVYRNSSAPGKFVKINLHTDHLSGNHNAVGSKVIVMQNGFNQEQELFPSRGWCSSSDYSLMFGLPQPEQSFSVRVVWPDGTSDTLTSNKKVINISETKSALKPNTERALDPLLVQSSLVSFKHKEDGFNAFNREALIPHMLTTEGPVMASGDVNGDGLDDIFISGGKNQACRLFLQTNEGPFQEKKVPDFITHQSSEIVAAVFFDADDDHDLDLAVASGGQEEARASEALKPRLYKNDGKGNFTYFPQGFPPVYLHASCIAPSDYDGDGDVDIFIGASVMPMLYGMSPISYLMVNDGTGKFAPRPDWLGNSQFDNPTRVRPGMIKDAVWCDVNGDKLPDLVVVGEWMPITVLLQQANHYFSNATEHYGLQNTRGWWNSVLAKDFDNDGDVDFVAGNLGHNSRIRASKSKPLQMYLGDFDSNGGSDHILVYYNGEHSYPFTSRDQLVKQIPSLKKKFLRYKDYRNVKLEDIVTPQQKGNSALMQVDEFSSVYIENDSAKLKVKLLPFEAQLFPVFGLSADDVDGDGNEDLILVGNLTATQPEIGPHDAGIGLVLKGNGKGRFASMNPANSGFVVKGEGRQISVLKDISGNNIYFVARNNDTTLSFKHK
jgi:hypothetical protein